MEIGPPPADRPTTVRAGDTEVEIPADPDAQPLAMVFKTIADPFVGQVSLLKVLSGTIRNDDHLVNSRTGTDERLHGLFVVRGKDHEPVDALAAGDIGGVAKLSNTATGDTLAPKGQPVHVDPIEPPAPVLATAVVAKTQADDDKLASALHRLQDEDPALVVDRDEETHQTVLRGTGETHLAITLERLERKFGVNLTTEDVQVRYRETISEPASAEGRHKKQSGGHGQFAVASIEVEPLERGEGFEFVDKIVGGAISRGYIPAVAKGVEETMGRGGVNGYPVVDVRVTLVDGKEHSVDSSEMAFRAAGRLAFREAMAKAAPVVLEPISRLDVTVPSDLLGDVMGDLNSRRGQGAGHRAGRGRRAGDLRPGARERAAPLRHRPALAHRWPRAVRHRPRPLRRAAVAPRRQDPQGRPRGGLTVADARSRRCDRGAPLDAPPVARPLRRPRRGRVSRSPGPPTRRERPLGRGPREPRDRTLTLLDRALEQVVVDDDPVLDPAVADAAQRAWPRPTPARGRGHRGARREAERMADRADRVSSGDWTRRGRRRRRR